MLSLFKDAEVSVTMEEVLKQARLLLVSSLNKGIIPSWDDFSLELPIMDNIDDQEEVRQKFLQLTTWPFLEEVLSADATEFFFHGPEDSQRLSYGGEKVGITLPLHKEDWQLWLEIISIHFRQNWNNENPFCSFYGKLFGKNYRLSLVHCSTSPHSVSKLIMRCLSERPHSLSSFGEVEILKSLISEKKNMVIAGSTGSGKTSLLTTLLNYVGPEEHLVILEDTHEILSSHPHQTRFISGDSPQTSLKAYLSYSLRMSPDRIILGEMRSHEVTPFLMAMNTGHKGLMGTLHASSAHDALHRIGLLFSLYAGEARLDFEKVMELLCRNLEYVVFMEKKKVTQIIKILGSEKGVAFYETILGEKPLWD